MRDGAMGDGFWARYLIPSGAIPPCIVESAISESCHLRKDIQYTFKNDIKSQ